MPAIKRTSDGKIIIKNGKPSCACCVPCDGLSVPASETKAVRDRKPSMTYSGNVQSNEFPASNLHCFVPKCKILAGSQIDDFGIIGGVTFKNNAPCSDEVDGEVTTVISDTEVAVTVVDNKINVAWSAESSVECGQPSGLGDLATYCTFYFYWVRK